MTKFNFNHWVMAFIIMLLPQFLYSQCQQLVWSDEFDGTTLDLSKWSYQIGNGTNDGLNAGWGNNESQYYTSRTQNVNVVGGNLEITARSESYLGASYTSGRIRSTNPITDNPKNDWQYGSFEARIKLPVPYNDSRIWPGFWMLPHDGPWPNTGEIDIMETGLDGQPWTYNGTLHYFSGAHQSSGTGAQTINTSPPCPGPNGDLSTCFHIYRVDWALNSISFFVDGVQVGVTRSSANTVGGAWPFDAANRFHILLNMAVGGWFPGTTAPNNARFPLTMQVDYVRVYSNPSATQITGKTKVMQGDNGLTYSVTADPASTFNWSVPAGATIVSGQGTSQITVNYGTAAASGNVSVIITPTGGGCVPVTVNLPVSVLANTCTLTLEDFEPGSPPTRNLGYNFSTGWLNRTCTTCQTFPYASFANPSAVAPNTSVNVGKYERNGGVQYDVIAYNDIAVGDASIFRNGVATFNMDVRTDAPAGTTVMVQLENRVNAQTGYPNGIYARYTAVTGAANTWTRLAFTLFDTPDLTMAASDVDQIVLFFNPNSYTTHTYYFDNFRRVGTTPNPTINGSASVCQNNAGVAYSLTGTLTGSTFNWTPTGIIASGQGTNSVTVNFGTANPTTLSAAEVTAVNCTVTKNLNVTVAGTCVLTANFAATPLTTCAGANVTFTDMSTGKTGGEIYSWDFGAGASLPAGTSGAGPHNVSYSTGGLKTASLTISKGAANDAETKVSYISVSAPPSGCLFSDDFDNSTVSWLSSGAFTHTESGTIWTVSNTGHAEWDNWTYTLNNGSTASPLNFSCPLNKPVLKIRAKASANALLRIAMLDNTGLATDNVPTYNLELTTTYQNFTIDYASHLRNYYSGTPGYLDSANIDRLLFFVNPGYTSFPYVGVNKTYNTSFPGTINIDIIGIGDNTCSVLPVELISFNATRVESNDVLLTWITATEDNNHYFEVLRSTDGRNFISVGIVKGVGNSSSQNNYSFIDKGLREETYYYKLNQIDVDGESSLSSAVVVKLDNSIKVDIVPTSVSSGEYVKIINASGTELENILITDLAGRVYSEFNNINESVLHVNTNGLSGVYLVRIVAGGQVLVKKMMVY